MKVREIIPQDAKSLVLLMSQLGYNTSESDLLKTIEIHSLNKTSWAYGVEIDDVIVATVSYHITPYFHCKGQMFRVTSLVVDENYKRQGLGRVLMDHALELAKKYKCGKIELTTSAHRKDEAHTFYESLGYKPYDGIRYLKKID